MWEFWFLLPAFKNKNTVLKHLENVLGPFGEQDDEQVFVQKVVPETPELFVRFASNGKR